MTKSILISLTLLFILTLAGGWLTENQTKIIREAGLEILEKIETEDSETIEPKETENSVTTKEQDDQPPYVVVRVIDGDTIVINKAGVSETVRLIGVDTPETVHPSKPVQCFGEEASRKTKEWLEGGRVNLEIDNTQGERDKYGRLLAYVYRNDGLFVNLELIKQGYAYEYTYNLPYKYQAEFKGNEVSAREKGVGLWAESVCQ